MQERNQEVYPYQTNEINLRKLFISLFARKLFIFGLTSFVTLLAIIYTFNLTTTYKASSSFTAPSDYSIIFINRLPLTDETNDSVFSNFLSLLISREFQTKVFLDGDYLSALNPESQPIDDVEDHALSFLSSISIEIPSARSQPTHGGYELISGNLIVNPYVISMEGSNDEIISRYLNELVIAADNKTIKELISLVKLKVDIRLDQISTERELLLAKARKDRLSEIARITEGDDQKIREINDQIVALKYQAEKNRLNEIIVLTSAAKIAKSLGIIENNFKQITNPDFDTTLLTSIGDNQLMPDWYLYGEKALLERIKMLNNRVSDNPFIPELVTLHNKLFEVQNNNLLKTLKARQDDSLLFAWRQIDELENETLALKSFVIDTSGVNSMQLSQTAFTSPIIANKRQIVLIAFFAGFVMSILLALGMDAFKTDEENSA